MTISKKEIFDLYRELIKEFPDQVKALDKFKELLLGKYRPQNTNKRFINGQSNNTKA